MPRSFVLRRCCARRKRRNDAASRAVIHHDLLKFKLKPILQEQLGEEIIAVIENFGNLN